MHSFYVRSQNTQCLKIEIMIRTNFFSMFVFNMSELYLVSLHFVSSLNKLAQKDIFCNVLFILYVKVKWDIHRFVL